MRRAALGPGGAATSWVGRRFSRGGSFRSALSTAGLEVDCVGCCSRAVASERGQCVGRHESTDPTVRVRRRRNVGHRRSSSRCTARRAKCGVISSGPTSRVGSTDASPSTRHPAGYAWVSTCTRRCSTTSATRRSRSSSPKASGRPMPTDIGARRAGDTLLPLDLAQVENDRTDSQRSPIGKQVAQHLSADRCSFTFDSDSCSKQAGARRLSRRLDDVPRPRVDATTSYVYLPHADARPPRAASTTDSHTVTRSRPARSPPTSCAVRTARTAAPTADTFDDVPEEDGCELLAAFADESRSGISPGTPGARRGRRRLVGRTHTLEAFTTHPGSP